MNIQYYKPQTNLIFSPTDTISIVLSDFYPDISSILLDGAIKTLDTYAVPNIEVFYVSGAYEVPILCNFIAEKKTNNLLGIITLGVVIKGQTRHNEHVEAVSFRKISDISAKFSLPITLGILTTDNKKQAMQRTGIKYPNKGIEATKALLNLLSVMQQKKVF